jgi:transketolase
MEYTMSSHRELVASLTRKSAENRRKLVDVLFKTGGGHFGGSLSCLEILTVLYHHILRIDPKNPTWAERDFFILSKGHANAGFSTVLATRGFFEEERLYTFNETGSAFGMHPTYRIPGVEIPTGSLGHGLSIGVGIALALRMNGQKARVFVLVGDGELHEGQNWEAIQSAASWKLDNLIAIVDRNRLSMDGSTEEVTIALDPLPEKWRSFNWADQTVNGHDVQALVDVLERVPLKSGQPSVVIADTIKGKGISFMENQYNWHYGVLNPETYQKAMAELSQTL